MRMCIWSANLLSFFSSQPSSHVLTSVFIPPESFSFSPLSLSLSLCNKTCGKNSNEDQRDFIIAHHHEGLQAYINNDRVTGKRLSAVINVTIMMIFQLKKPFSELEFWCFKISADRTHLSTARSHNATVASDQPSLRGLFYHPAPPAAAEPYSVVICLKATISWHVVTVDTSIKLNSTGIER